MKFFNVRSNPIDLVAGKSYSIKIVPFQHIATPEVRSLFRESRKCLFNDEPVSQIKSLLKIGFHVEQFQKEKSMFKVYSQKGCLFECRLENTFSSVGCIPWDFPMPPSVEGKEVPICTSTKVNSFDIVLYSYLSDLIYFLTHYSHPMGPLLTAIWQSLMLTWAARRLPGAASACLTVNRMSGLKLRLVSILVRIYAV